MAQNDPNSGSIPTTTGAGGDEPADEEATARSGSPGSSASIPTTSGAGGDEGAGAGESPTTEGARGTMPTSGQ